MGYEEEYDRKVELLRKCVAHERTDCVPIVSMVQTWAISYAGTNAEDALSNVEREFEVYSKYLRDFHFDGAMIFG